MGTSRRNALVTGSTRNIGRAIAIALASDGCNVLVHGKSDEKACRSVAAEVADLGVESTHVLADLGKRDEVDGLVQAARDKFDRIDILVNCAAIRPHVAFLEMKEAEWHEVLETNLNSAFRLIRAFLPGMVRNHWGRIINFAGLNAIRGYTTAAHVSASKHALWGLTKSLAKDYGKNGVTSNVISPGPTRDEDSQNLPSNVSPIGRIGKPREIAAIASMLVGEDGAYINGQMIQVNGGLET